MLCSAPDYKSSHMLPELLLPPVLLVVSSPQHMVLCRTIKAVSLPFACVRQNQTSNRDFNQFFKTYIFPYQVQTYGLNITFLDGQIRYIE